MAGNERHRSAARRVCGSVRTSVSGRHHEHPAAPARRAGSALRRRDGSPHGRSEHPGPLGGQALASRALRGVARDRPLAARRAHRHRRHVVPGGGVLQSGRDVLTQCLAGDLRTPGGERCGRRSRARGHHDQGERLSELVRAASRRGHRLARRCEAREGNDVPHVPAAPRRRRRRGRRTLRPAGGEGRGAARARRGGNPRQAVRERPRRGRDAGRVLQAGRPEARRHGARGSGGSPPVAEEQSDIGEETGFHVAIGAGECAA